jgi:hypothetical protein
MNTPKLKNYGTAENTRLLNFGPVTVWFSYETAVAFRVDGLPQRVLNYKGSKTTYKHLNMIDGGNKENRLNEADFQRLWDKEVGSRVKN